VNSTELLARMPSQLGGRLEVCSCGHTPEAHPGRGGCRHRNRASQKRGLPAAQCECGRFTPDPRLPDGEVFVRRVLQKVLAKEQIPAELVELEDALSVLIRQLWITCDKYDSRSHVRFRVYAYLELYNDAIDHFRSERGRQGRRWLVVWPGRLAVSPPPPTRSATRSSPNAKRCSTASSRDSAPSS
jgi:hypothetical protein